MIETTRAAVLREIGKPLSIEALTLPDNLDVGQVLIEMAMAGVCGRQKQEAAGDKGPDKYLPHLMGHEGAGKVLKVGRGVRKVKPGDRVCLHWRKGSGIDAAPPTYQSESGPVGAGPVACFGTRVVVSENRVTGIPGYLPYWAAALLGCGVTTGLGIVYNEAKVKFGDTVVVIGCGGVGLAAIHGASIAGAMIVVAVDCDEKALGLARALGAHIASNAIRGWTFADIIIECTGDPAMVNDALGKLAPGGKLILCGQPRAGSQYNIQNADTLFRGIRIMDSQGGLTNPDVDILRCAEMWKAKILKLGVMTGHMYSLDEINDALINKKGVPGRSMIALGDLP